MSSKNSQNFTSWVENYSSGPSQLISENSWFPDPSQINSSGEYLLGQRSDIQGMHQTSGLISLNIDNPYSTIIDTLNQRIISPNTALSLFFIYIWHNFPREAIPTLIEAARDQHEYYIESEKVVFPQVEEKPRITLEQSPIPRKPSPIIIEVEE